MKKPKVSPNKNATSDEAAGELRASPLQEALQPLSEGVQEADQQEDGHDLKEALKHGAEHATDHAPAEGDPLSAPPWPMLLQMHAAAIDAAGDRERTRSFVATAAELEASRAADADMPTIRSTGFYLAVAHALLATIQDASPSDAQTIRLAMQLLRFSSQDLQGCLHAATYLEAEAEEAAILRTRLPTFRPQLQ